MAPTARQEGASALSELPTILSAIPSLPRPVLRRLTARLIERLDEIDGDPVLGDDAPAGGNVEDEGEIDNEDGDQIGYRMHQRRLWAIHGAMRVR